MRILVSPLGAISNTYFRIIYIIVFVQSRMLSLIDRVSCMHERSPTTPHLAQFVFFIHPRPVGCSLRVCVCVCVCVWMCVWRWARVALR